MPTYAILGSTGQTGSELVRLLIANPDHKLHVHARSASRLHIKHPSLANNSNVETFIGDISDRDVLARCLTGVDVVFSAVAQNRNEPGCSVAQRTALATIQALESARNAFGKEKGAGTQKYKAPTVVFLASGAVDPSNPDHKRLPQRIMHWVIYHVYTDLELAIDLLLKSENAWIPVVFACAGGLVNDNHPDRSVRLMEGSVGMSGLMSYRDLAKGMVMMGEENEAFRSSDTRGTGNKGKWTSKYVGMVVNDGKPIGGDPLALLRYLIPNLIAMVFPALWWWGKNYWPA